MSREEFWQCDGFTMLYPLLPYLLTRSETDPAQNGENGLVCIDAASRRSADDGSDGGEKVRTPARTEAAGDLAVGGGGPRFSLATVVVGRDVRMFEEGE